MVLIRLLTFRQTGLQIGAHPRPSGFKAKRVPRKRKRISPQTKRPLHFNFVRQNFKLHSRVAYLSRDRDAIVSPGTLSGPASAAHAARTACFTVAAGVSRLTRKSRCGR